MDVFIIGGTGFIGYHAALAFHQRGDQVSVLALPPIPIENLLPPQVQIHFGDLSSLADSKVRDLLGGVDALVFAAGADDRVIPKSPSTDYFFKRNVLACKRLFQLARDTGVRRGVIIGSYFAHFDRIWPEMELAVHHPYIRSRVAQITQSMQAALPDLELMVLELPYVFGAMPGRPSLWKPLIRYMQSPFPLFYPRGGTNVMAVQHVAEAIVGAVLRGDSGGIYQIGEENLTWVDLLTRLSIHAGVSKRIITLPDWIIRLGMVSLSILHKFQGKAGGLDLVKFTDLQTSKTFIDPESSRRVLGYGQGGLDAALKETVRVSLSTAKQP